MEIKNRERSRIRIFYYIVVLFTIVIFLNGCSLLSTKSSSYDNLAPDSSNVSSGTSQQNQSEQPTPVNSPTPTLPPQPQPTPLTPTVQPSPIPVQYQALYNELSVDMSDFEGFIAQNWNGNRGQTTFATELAYANGNVGESLLSPGTLDQNKLMLDRLQSMGVKGVVLAIKFPLLKPDFPRSTDYLNFYKQIIAMCRAHNMKVLVECGAIFAGTPYSPVQVDWSKYTTQTFLQGLQDQLVVIANEIKPDYLTLANEPTTEESLTKLTITPGDWSDFITRTIKQIGNHSGTLLGAGTGTWENQAYINTLYKMPGLDYIDLHIYPAGEAGSLWDRAFDNARQAINNGKKLTISECWLWKTSVTESGGNLMANSEQTMNRDVYSFWSPLDSRFMQDIMNLADATSMDFASFFWTRNLFSYLNYDITPHNLTTDQYNRLINQASLANLQNGKPSDLGLFFQQQLLLRGTK